MRNPEDIQRDIDACEIEIARLQDKKAQLRSEWREAETQRTRAQIAAEIGGAGD